MMTKSSQVKIGLSISFILLAVACSKAPVAPDFGKRSTGGGGGVGEGDAGGDPDNINPDGTVKTPEQIQQEQEEIKADEKIQVALAEEFQLFTKAADEVDLKTKENLGKIPALIVKSQLAIDEIFTAESKEVPEEPKGRCLLFLSGDKVLTDKDVVSKDFELSPGKKVLFTTNAKLEPADCQKVFKEALPERYKTDFFQIHEVFFSVK